MSLHVNLTSDAVNRLQKQRRNSTITSICIAVLSVLLVGLILGIFLLPSIIQETPQIVTYETSIPEETQDDVKKPQAKADRNPAAPSSSMAKVIAANAVAPSSVPVPDVEATNPSLDFGMDNNFGDGWGTEGMGDGGGLGGGGGFGSSAPGSGGLRGFYYALEHSSESSEKKPIHTNLTRARYEEALRGLQGTDYSSSILSKHYTAPKPLYLNYLAIPNTLSAEGPSLFGAEWLSNKKYARCWLAHYRGTVKVPKTGTYRFSGTGDNYLHVRIDGNTVMHYGYAPPSNWTQEAPQTTRHQSPYTKGWMVQYGKWVNLRAGQYIKMDISVGDEGGWCGFHLQIEEKGVEYRHDANGRPILPLFTTAKFGKQEIDKLTETFKPYEFDFTKVIVFPVKR